MNIWKVLCALVLSTISLSTAFAAGASPVGNWTTIDDKTGMKRAVVHLSLSGDTLNGTIVKVYPQPGDKGICENCPGNFKGKPVAGLRFVWGLKDQGNGVWGGGSILDPKTGKVYKAKMTLSGNKLYVRGFIGVSVLGRTQTWER